MHTTNKRLKTRARRAILAISLLVGSGTANAVQVDAASLTAHSDETLVIGKSVRGIPIVAKRYGAVGGKVVVAVGTIHGNEKIGLSITAALAVTGGRKGFTLWIIDSANPDGTRLNQRWNANMVDLNRNFDVNWKKIPCTYKAKSCSGTKPMSEPETVALAKFMLTIQPQMVIFYHATGRTIDFYKGAVARPQALVAYSKVSGMPRGTVSCGPNGCTGTATQYIYKSIPTSTPFVIELPCDTPCLAPARIKRHVRAFWAAAAEMLTLETAMFSADADPR